MPLSYILSGVQVTRRSDVAMVPKVVAALVLDGWLRIPLRNGQGLFATSTEAIKPLMSSGVLSTLRPCYEDPGRQKLFFFSLMSLR